MMVLLKIYGTALILYLAFWIAIEIFDYSGYIRTGFRQKIERYGWFLIQITGALGIGIVVVLALMIVWTP